MKRMVWGFLAALAVLSGVCASGQNTVSVVSAFSNNRSSVPAECHRQVDVLWQTIQRYPHPAGWRWILLCDDPSWDRFLIHIDHADGLAYAETDLAGETTVWRGATLLRPDRVEAQPDHVIAHELAHIALRSPDEGRAEALALEWMRGHSRPNLQKASSSSMAPGLRQAHGPGGGSGNGNWVAEKVR